MPKNVYLLYVFKLMHSREFCCPVCAAAVPSTNRILDPITKKEIGLFVKSILTSTLAPHRALSIDIWTVCVQKNWNPHDLVAKQIWLQFLYPSSKTNEDYFFGQKIKK